MKTCYMCEQPAISREHVPPKCIFPEQKDSPGKVDYKKNLITVPACAEHNLKTSMDDEYLLAIIAFHWRNNEVAENQSSTKIARALRGSKHYYDLFFGPNRHQFLYWQGDILVTSDVDINRLNSELDKIARGIFYHHFRQKWTNAVSIRHFSLAAIYKQSHPVIDALNRISELMRQACILERKHGSNPAVFFYQIAGDTPPTSTFIRMVFYGGFEIVAVLDAGSGVIP